MYNISANTIFTGKTIICLPTCHSTNDHASNLLSEGNPIEGTLIITPNQTAGKGQRGRSWEAESGKNLTFSLIYRPTFLPISQQFYLNIITSLAVRDTLAYFLKTEVKVKWPNDIYLTNKKICGILIQNSLKKSTITGSIIGIGINVNQETFSDKKAISMINYAGTEFSVNELLNYFLSKMEVYYLKLREMKLEELTDLYISNLYRYNELNYFKTMGVEFRGKITGIDKIGRLQIESDEKTKLFDFKEVEFLN